MIPDLTSMPESELRRYAHDLATIVDMIADHIDDTSLEVNDLGKFRSAIAHDLRDAVAGNGCPCLAIEVVGPHSKADHDRCGSEPPCGGCTDCIARQVAYYQRSVVQNAVTGYGARPRGHSMVTRAPVPRGT